MRFAYAPAEPVPSPAVAVDGACAAELQLSHWPGNRTPSRYKRDLGVEIALAFARDPENARDRFQAVTNDHYDADGVLSAFAVLRPEEALSRASDLVLIAAAGDFAEVQNERALKANAVLAGLLDHQASPIAAELRGLAEPQADAKCYAYALERLPALADEMEKHEAVWSDEWAWYVESRDAMRAGAIQVTELGEARLSVVEADFEPHPAIVQEACAGDLFLLAIPSGSGFEYRADWRYHAWAETVKRKPIASVSLEKLALPLNALESNRLGRWRHEGYPGRGRTEALAFVNGLGAPQASSLSLTEVVSRLAWYLIDRREGATRR